MEKLSCRSPTFGKLMRTLRNSLLRNDSQGSQPDFWVLKKSECITTRLYTKSPEVGIPPGIKTSITGLLIRRTPLRCGCHWLTFQRKRACSDLRADHIGKGLWRIFRSQINQKKFYNNILNPKTIPSACLTT